MKKYVKIFLVILLAITLTACKDTKKQKEEPTKEEQIKEQHKEVVKELHSDGNKLVMSNIDSKIVFYFEGDNITGREEIYEFSTKEEAKAAYDKDVLLYPEGHEYVKGVDLVDNYVILTYRESAFEAHTVTEIKEMYVNIEEVHE